MGGGPAGLAAAVLLARGGLGVALIAPRKKEPDARTVALMQPSIRLLETMAVWSRSFAALAQPLRKLTLVDDTGNFFSAPRVTFTADELGLEAFGWNIPLDHLVAEFTQKAQDDGVEILDGTVAKLSVSSELATLSLSGSSSTASRIVIAADGRNSAIRQFAGIACDEWSYDQSALVASFDHSVGHQDVSTEYLRPSGPLTTVPLPGCRSSLVWMDRPVTISRLMELPDEKFLRQLQAAMHGELGLLTDVGRRQAFPMRGLLASGFGAKRVVLVGEAAHLMPPIGAQGLNIGLRDAAMAAELVLDAANAGADIGGDDLVRAYAEFRKQDVLIRQGIVHTFNRSLLADFLPLGLARAAGVALVERFGPLRRYIMRQGLGPSWRLPRVMHESSKIKNLKS